MNYNNRSFCNDYMIFFSLYSMYNPNDLIQNMTFILYPKRGQIA